MSDEILDPAAISVTKGNPTPEEMAALVTVLCALSAGSDRKPHQPETGTLAGGWKSYWRVIRQPLLPGREAWRGSLR